MSKRQALMLLGVWVILIPLFLGFPGNWNGPILVITGILIVFIAYRSKSASPAEPIVPADAPYVEHRSEPVPISPSTAVQDVIPPAVPPIPPVPSNSPIIDANAETVS